MIVVKVLRGQEVIKGRLTLLEALEQPEVSEPLDAWRDQYE
jgi:hypothetical protein